MPDDGSARAQNSVQNSVRGNPDKIQKYQFKPGQSGNPGGRPKTTPITDIFRKVAHEHPELLEETVTRTLADNRMASILLLRLMSDRLEGPETERLQVSGTDGGPLSMTVRQMDERIAELVAKWEKARQK